MFIWSRVRLKQDNFVYFGFMLAIVKYAFASTAFRLPHFCNILLMMAALCCFITYIVLTQVRGKHFFIFLISLVVSIATYLSNGHDDDLIIMAVAVYALKDINIEKLIKYYAIVMLSFFSLVIVHSLITGENIGIYAGFRVARGYEYRYTFGFVHPNSLQGLYMWLVCGLILSRWGQDRKKIKCILLEIINIILFLLSDSRTGFLVVTAVLIMRFFSEYVIRKFGRKLFLFGISILNMGIISFTIFAAGYYNKFDFLRWISTLITGRFEFANRFLSRFPVRLFGSDIVYKNEYGYSLILDCGIMNTLLHYGLIVFIVSVVIYMLGVRRMWEQHNYGGMIVVTGYLIYSVMENIYFSIFTNLGLILCCYYVINKGKIQCNRKDYRYEISTYSSNFEDKYIDAEKIKGWI